MNLETITFEELAPGDEVIMMSKTDKGYYVDHVISKTDQHLKVKMVRLKMIGITTFFKGLYKANSKNKTILLLNSKQQLKVE